MPDGQVGPGLIRYPPPDALSQPERKRGRSGTA
jgi:hypothetical protein